MRQKSGSNRGLMVLMIIGVVLGIVSILAVNKTIPETFGQFFPAVEQLDYLNITAEGERTGSGVTREKEVMAELLELAAAIPMEDKHENFIGRDYSGTMYRLKMGYEGSGTYEFQFATDGSVYHSNGKYFLPLDGTCDELFQWVEEFTKG